jgi:hypothetical protein
MAHFNANIGTCMNVDYCSARGEGMKKRHSQILSSVVLVLCGLFLFNAVEIHSALSESLVWIDDFTYKDARWNWASNAGTGYKECPKTVDGYSVCEGGVSASSTSSVYSDCSLHSFISVAESQLLRVEFRMRYTDEEKGTKGCGWWDGSSIGDNVAWFMYFSPESDVSLRGFRCQVRRAGTFHLNQLITVDMTQWHVYRVDLLSNGTFFYVDDQLAASSSHRPQVISKLDAWVDNGYIYFSGTDWRRGNLDLDINEKMFIDWTKLTALTPSPSSSPTPSSSTPTPTTTPTQSLTTPTPTGTSAIPPTSMPTVTPSSPMPTSSPEPTTFPSEFLPPEAFYAATIIGVASITAILVLALKKQKNRK